MPRQIANSGTPRSIAGGSAAGWSHRGPGRKASASSPPCHRAKGGRWSERRWRASRRRGRESRPHRSRLQSGNEKHHQPGALDRRRGILVGGNMPDIAVEFAEIAGDGNDRFRHRQTPVIIRKTHAARTFKSHGRSAVLLVSGGNGLGNGQTSLALPTDRHARFRKCSFDYAGRLAGRFSVANGRRIVYAD